MYNDYYYNNNMGNSMMWQGLPKKHFSWNNILNNTQRTLGIINQAIPLIYQVRPLVTNARTLFRVANAINEKDEISNEETNESYTNSYKEEKDSNGPIFYL